LLETEACEGHCSKSVEHLLRDLFHITADLPGFGKFLAQERSVIA
jgi:hypothetical protein